MNTDQLKVWSAISDHPANYYVAASESEREAWRDWVRGVLQKHECTVDFDKANGEFRSMKCTLCEDLGAKYTVTENTNPKKPNPKKPNPKKPNPDVCVVWDTAQQAWRSFRLDRMRRIQFDLG
jgi:hypothetical protein